MATVVLTVHLLLALGLIVVVLLQRSEGGGLGIGGGAGVMTGRGAATALSKVTWALGIAFVVTSLMLTILAARQSASESVIDRIDPAVESGSGPADPAAPLTLGGGDLLPPVPGIPAAPPAAD